MVQQSVVQRAARHPPAPPQQTQGTAAGLRKCCRKRGAVGAVVNGGAVRDTKGSQASAQRSVAQHSAAQSALTCAGLGVCKGRLCRRCRALAQLLRIVRQALRQPELCGLRLQQTVCEAGKWPQLPSHESPEQKGSLVPPACAHPAPGGPAQGASQQPTSCKQLRASR